jgi:hypothetical protein
VRRISRRVAQIAAILNPYRPTLENPLYARQPLQ